MEERFMTRALELAGHAAEADEVPVGAVVVFNGEIVGEGENRKERDGDATAHAEMVALREAQKRMGRMLCDCDLYVTLEPCAMCAGAALACRMRSIYFGAFDDKAGCCGSLCDLPSGGSVLHRIRCEGGIMREECASLLTEFFKRKRTEKKEAGRRPENR